MNKTTPDLPATSEKTTVELCADELANGVRCILSRGHEGDHQFQSPYATGSLTWKQQPSQ